MTDTSDVPLDYVVEQLEQTVYEGRGRGSEAEVELDVSEPEWMDGADDWLVSISDIVEEDSLNRGDGYIDVVADTEVEEDGYEIRRRNATGGDYVDIRQFLHIEGRLAFKMDEQHPEEVIADPANTSLVVHCHFDTGNYQSYRGERPPF